MDGWGGRRIIRYVDGRREEDVTWRGLYLAKGDGWMCVESVKRQYIYLIMNWL